MEMEFIFTLIIQQNEGVRGDSNDSNDSNVHKLQQSPTKTKESLETLESKISSSPNILIYGRNRYHEGCYHTHRYNSVRG